MTREHLARDLGVQLVRQRVAHTDERVRGPILSQFVSRKLLQCFLAKQCDFVEEGLQFGDIARLAITVEAELPHLDCKKRSNVAVEAVLSFAISTPGDPSNRKHDGDDKRNDKGAKLLQGVECVEW